MAEGRVSLSQLFFCSLGVHHPEWSARAAQVHHHRQPLAGGPVMLDATAAGGVAVLCKAWGYAEVMTHSMFRPWSAKQVVEVLSGAGSRTVDVARPMLQLRWIVVFDLSACANQPTCSFIFCMLWMHIPAEWPALPSPQMDCMAEAVPQSAHALLQRLSWKTLHRSEPQLETEMSILLLTQNENPYSPFKSPCTLHPEACYS